MQISQFILKQKLYFQMNAMDLSPNYVATLVAINQTLSCSAGFISPAITGVMTAEEVIDCMKKYDISSGICVNKARNLPIHHHQNYIIMKGHEVEKIISSKPLRNGGTCSSYQPEL